MSVDFEDENSFEGHTYKRIGYLPETGKITTWLMKRGLVKNEEQAAYVLIIVLVLALVMTFIVFSSNSYRSNSAQKINLDDYSIQGKYPPQLKIYAN